MTEPSEETPSNADDDVDNTNNADCPEETAEATVAVADDSNTT